ncbi:hypothetical protein MLD38_001271 [Melastoma candidum]|nr:hypothetical protein MLD38_001271 [Melastoma candidum]
MYAKCGCLEDARVVFDGTEGADTVSWTALIAGYVKAHRPDDAVSVFEKMEKSGRNPDQVALVTVVSAYISLGKLDLAYKLFCQIQNPSIIAWNIMISVHAKKGFEEEAVEFFQRMRQSGGKSTRSTLGSVLSAIAGLARSDYGSIVHAEAIKRGLSSNVYVGSSLINMYAKCKDMGSATKVFLALDEKNVVLWNAMLGGFTQNGYADEVLSLYWEMIGCGFQPDEYTYTSIFSACACLQYLELGRQLHGMVLKNTLASHLFVGNALVDMYAKCGNISESKKQFECQKIHDKVSWNAIIVGYVQEEEEYEAFEMFQRMSSSGIVPDEVALASILSACASIQSLRKGEKFHCLAVKCGLDTSLYTGSSLIDMYAKCGVVEAAYCIYLCMPDRSIASMNAMISGCASSDLHEAISIFEEMRATGMSPSQVTFACLLDACNRVDKLSIGKQVHSVIIRSGVSYHDDFLGISLMGMYLNAQFLTDANMIFQEFPFPKSKILWTALISGYVHNDCNEEALHYFREMRSYDTPPDQATFASVLKACAALCSLRDGRQIHSIVFLYGFDADELTACALIDMYAKCGEIGCSVQVFDGIDEKIDVIIWNSMIVGLAQNGFAKNALEVFDSMKQSNVVPDDVTFLGILTACSHAGLVSQGRSIYQEMVKHYNISPRSDHNACMVDLLGRWGSIGEAVKFIDDLSCKPDSMIWTSLLGACRLHGDEVRGKLAAEKLMESEPQNPTPYILLSNIYAAAGNWHEVNLLRRKMKENEVKKSPGFSWIYVGQEVNHFVAGDDSHHSSGEIRQVLNELTNMTKKEDDVEEEYFLCGG